MAPLLLHVFPSFDFGGAQVRFAAIVNRFGPRWRHAIIAMDGHTGCAARLNPSLDVSFPQIAIRKGDTLGNIRSFRRILRELRPQTLVTSNWGSTEWAMANALPVGTGLKIRHVHMEDGFGPEERSTQLPRRVWTRRVLLRRSHIMVPSRVLFGIATDIWRLGGKRLHYIPNGVDLARFDAPPANNPIPVIGTVAALRAEKNLSRLIRAFAHAIADGTPGLLRIVGDGPQRGELETLAATLGISDRVDFTGHDPAPQLRYRGFDIFAMSSDTEQMPLSLLEAMAAGLPAAATNVGDIGAMLPPEASALLTPLDDAALGDALATLLRDPDLRRRLGTANRAKATQDYDIEAMFQSYAKLFDGI